MGEIKGNLTNFHGQVVHPNTEVGAILDFYQKAVSKDTEQLDIKGKKDFNDGILIGGKRVLVEGEAFKEAKAVPGNDLQAISASGFYYYTGAEKNLPPRDNEYRSGYIIASFTDANNGIVLLIGGLIYYEKFQGKWRKPFSPKPMTLWSGDAKPGDKLTLTAPIQEFNYLRFYLHVDGFDSNYVVTSTNHQRFFVVTQTGLSEDGKAFRGVELVLEKSGNGKTFNFNKCTIGNNGTATVVKKPCLWRIEGGRDR